MREEQPLGRRQNLRKGVTLTELVVAVGIFSLLALVLGGVFLSLSRLQQQAFRSARLLDNARFAIDSITRTLRTVSSSEISDPPGDTPSGTQSITFNHRGKVGGRGCPDPLQPCVITYQLAADGRLMEQNQQGAGPTVSGPLTSSEVVVEDFRVYFSGRANADMLQPRAIVVLRIRDRNEGPEDALSLQTTVSLRPLDLE